jgi:hypothetical protein
LLAERVERQVLCDRQVVAILAAGSGKRLDLPEVDDALERLDAALVAEPQRVEPEQDELLRALGVGRG